MGRKLEGLVWAGGEHDFALYLGEIEALQDKCDAGPEFVYRSTLDGTWRQSYLFNTIRLGLIGAGMSTVDAAAVMARVEDRPLREFVPVANLILGAALVGVVDDEPGKDLGEAESQNAPNSPAESGASLSSTDPAQP